MRRYLIPILISELVAGGSAVAAGPVPVGSSRIGGSREVEPEKTYIPETGRFDAKTWTAVGGYSRSRLGMFSRLLSEYNLIGMQQEEVLRLLGIGYQSRPADYKGGLRSVTHWVMRGDSCRPEGMNVMIHFENGTVDSWCFVREDSWFFDREDKKELSAPVTTNVLLSELSPPRLSSASIMAAKPWWPATIPKNPL